MAWALLEILLPLILAILLGVLIGWFLWRWRRTRVSHTEWSSMQMKSGSASNSKSSAAELAEIKSLKADLSGRKGELQKSASRISDLEGKLASASAGGAELQGLKGDLKSRDGDLGKVRAELKSRDADLKSRDADLEKLKAELKAKDSELASASAGGAELQGLKGDLKSRDGDLDKVRADLKARDADLASRDADLKSRDADLKSRDADLKSRDADLEKLKAELKAKDSELASASAAGVELQGLKGDLKSRDGDLDKVRADLKARDADLKTRDGDLDKVRADLKARDADLKSRDGDLDKVRADLKARDGDLGTSKARIVELEGLLSSRDSDLAAASAESKLRPVIGDERHPYGVVSHAPFLGAVGDMPDGYPIKGNVDSMLYHREDSRVYVATDAEVWFDTVASAEAAGFGLAKSHPKDGAASSGTGDSGSGSNAGGRAVIGGKQHPYGGGSHAPFEGAVGDMPDGYPVKGNVDSMLYHREDSRFYVATDAEVWFDTPASAEAAGFSLAKSHPKGDGAGGGDSRPVAGGNRHPHGAGSHAPFDGAPNDMPKGYPIKGNDDSMLYHREDSRSYKVTIAEVWFDTEKSAQAAGFSLASTHPKS